MEKFGETNPKERGGFPLLLSRFQRDPQTSIEADLSEAYRKRGAESERPSGFREEQATSCKENSLAELED